MILASRTVLLNKDSVQFGYVLPSFGGWKIKQSWYVRSKLSRSEVRRSQTDGGGPLGDSRKEYTLESLSWQGEEDTSICALIPDMAKTAAKSRGKLVVVVPELGLPATKYTHEREHKVNTCFLSGWRPMFSANNSEMHPDWWRGDTLTTEW